MSGNTPEEDATVDLDSPRCPSENALLDFGSGRLDTRERADVEAHIDGCPSCFALVADIVGLQPPESTAAEDDRYVRLDNLGRGGMGEVYGAFDRRLGRRVALKVLQRASGPTASARMLREGQAMAQLSHPNVVPVYDVDEGPDGRVFMAMEFVDGVTLAQWESSSWKATLDVYLGAGEGLAAAHGRGLVHRDFKPHNVMVRRDGRAQVMDFGLARRPDGLVSPSGSSNAPPQDGSGSLSPALGPLTDEQMAGGTPAYMAPEQHRGEDVDGRADQFAFCVSLYESLQGQRPFQAKTARALYEAKKQGPSALAPLPVPGPVQRVIFQGLAPEPEQRFANMNALLAALRKARRLTALQRGGLGLLVLLCVAVALALWSERQQRVAIDRCVAAGIQVTELWSQERAAKVERAVRDTRVSYADDTAEALPRYVDPFLSELEQAQRTVCVQADAMPELHAKARACLFDAELEFDMLLDAVASANEAVVQEVVPSLASLPDPRRCVDPAHLELVPDPAEGDTRRARELLFKALAASRLQQFDRAAELASAARDEAVELDAAALAARALFLLGEAQAGAGQYERARDSLTAAYFEALDVGTPETSIRAAISLTSLVGMELREPVAGRAWSRHAQSLIRHGSVDAPVLEADRLTRLAVLEFTAGNPTRSIELGERALELYEKELGPEHPKLVVALINLANVHDDVSDDTTSLDRAQRALEILIRNLGPRHPKVAAGLSIRALNEVSVGDLDAAAGTLERAIEIREAALGREHPGLSPLLNNLANVQRIRGEWDAASDLYRRAASITEKARGSDHPKLAFPLTGLVLVGIERGDPASVREPAQRAVAIRERHRGAPHLLGAARFNLAQVVWATGEEEDRKRALELAELALASFKASPGREEDVERVRAWIESNPHGP